MQQEQRTKVNSWLKGCVFPSFLAIGFVAILPSLVNIHEKPYGLMAMNALVMYAKECAVKKAMDEINPAINVTKLEKHKITPIDGNCDGDEKGLITALSIDLSKYPTFIYNVKTGEKTCSHNGVKWDQEQERHYHGCTAKINGTWFEITNW